MSSATSTWKHRLFILQRMSASFFHRMLGTWNLKLQPRQLFSIKAGYHHALRVEPFDDTINKDEWQRKVYELAAGMAQELKQPSIIDVGCGSAYKLIHQLGQYDTTGIEVAPTYQWLREQYPDRKWLLFDAIVPENLPADIVICSDVIEHIEDPDEMMDFLAAMPFRYLIISTPERDTKAGKRDYGPPVNTSHYREWNAVEFRNYVRNWFHIQEHHIFDDKSITQAVICIKK